MPANSKGSSTHGDHADQSPLQLLGILHYDTIMGSVATLRSAKHKQFGEEEG